MWDDDGECENGEGYPPGEHPLEGVANLEDLAEPEALSAKVDLSEVGVCAAGMRVLALLGEWLIGFPTLLSPRLGVAIIFHQTTTETEA